MNDGGDLIMSLPKVGIEELDGALAYEIAEHERMEVERNDLKARVQHSQKLESLGVLAGAIAHDFNNFLTGILGNAGMVLRKLPDDSVCRAMVEEIEYAAQHAAALSAQMLAYSGHRETLRQPVDLKLLIDEMAPLLRISISKKASLSFDLADELPAVEGDPSQIRQVIMNLTTNASESLNEQSGVISISAGLLEADHAYLEQTDATDLAEGPYVYIEVSDTGCGISEETRQHIYDPAFTTKNPGRGLGLAAVQGIVREHEGAIKLDSVTGRGTTFKVLLAASEHVLAPAIAGRGVDPAVGELWEERGTVLVVDDEKIVRDVAESILEDFGYEVMIADDGLQALEIFEDHGEKIDLVLLDMTMPRLDGAETFRELRRMRPGLRVILSSGFDNEMAVEGITEEAGVSFIQKPYRPMDLIEKVQAID